MSYTPPPPSDRATPRQIGMLFGFAVLMTLFVMLALFLSRGESMRVGVILIVLGLFFGVGMVLRNRIVEYLSAGVLALGAGMAVALASKLGEPLWYIGAVFFVLCAGIILSKDRLRGDPPDAPTA